MKKNLFLAALAGVALVGCAKNEVAQVTDDSQNAVIAFTPVVANTTKAQSGEIPTTYNTSESFRVFGFYCTDASFTPSNASVYMDNIKCEYNPSINVDPDDPGTGAWTPEKTYYWPKNGKLTFSAYSPEDAVGTITCGLTSGLKIGGFSVDANVANQYDLLYSDRAYDKTTSIGTTNPTYDGVDIVFHHALSSIHVNVAAAESYAAGALTINSVNILNAWFTGDFLEGLTLGTEPDSKLTSYWEGQYNEIGEFIIGNTSTDISTQTTPAQYGTTALLIPQKFDHGTNHVKLQIKYTIKNGDDTTLPQEATFDLTTEANYGVVDGTNTTITQWVKGYRYTYNITIGLEEIYFAPSVDEWKDATITVPTI